MLSYLKLSSRFDCYISSLRSSSITRSSHGEHLHAVMPFVAQPLTYSESCVKGHRSSSCKHTDRPLFEIKKKGRPVSQCEKCRKLRQSKRVHSKCNCNLAEGVNIGPSSSQ